MGDEGIRPGDYVIVRQQEQAASGDLVIALPDGKNTLKKPVVDGNRLILGSHNERYPEAYPDIVAEDGGELLIQGVVVGVYHEFI